LHDDYAGKINKETDENRFLGGFFAELFVKDISGQKDRTVHDIAQGSGDAKQFDSFHDLNIGKDRCHGHPGKEADFAEQVITQDYQAKINDGEDNPYHFICHGNPPINNVSNIELLYNIS